MGLLWVIVCVLINLLFGGTLRILISDLITADFGVARIVDQMSIAKSFCGKLTLFFNMTLNDRQVILTF